MKTLGGTLFIYNGRLHDYHHVQSIQCLKDLCDHVVVCDAGSDDGTVDDLLKLEDDKCSIIYLNGKEWIEQKGKEKLNYFTNKAIEQLNTDWAIDLQADECIQEQSFPFIREAIEIEAEGFLTRRHNLWKDPYHQLNVVQSRRPCSTEIIRLTKTKYRSHGDAESKECYPINIDFLDKIEFVHTGYVRDPLIMKKKVIWMQEQVFGMNHDKKLDLSDRFEWDHYFSEDDLVPIRKPLPIYVQKWAEERYPNIK